MLSSFYIRSLLWVEKEARMAEEYILDIERDQVPRYMPLPRPLEIGEFSGFGRGEPRQESIVYIPHLSGEDN